MAFYDTADALYGIGTYGSARYGRVTPVVQVTGVGATANTRTIHLNVFEVDITEPIYNAQGATGSVGGLTLNTTAGIDGVSATGTANSVGVGVSRLLGSVSATTALGSIQVNTTEIIDSVSATFTINGDGLSVRSVNTVEVSGVSGTTTVGTPEAQTTEPVESVSATGFVNTVTVNLSEKLDSVSATGSIDSLTIHTTAGLTGVVGTGQIGSVGGAPTEKISTGVEATVIIGTVTTNISERMVSTNLTGTIGDVTTTAQVFDFQAVRNQYSRKRTVYIPRAA